MIDSETVPTGSTTKESPCCLLPSSGLYCSPLNRPTNQDTMFWARNTATLLRKSSRLRRWWTRVPKNHLTQVRIQASFYPKRIGSVTGGCKLFGAVIPCSCSCPHWSGHSAVIYHQQNKCSATFHLYMKWKILCLWRSEPWKWTVYFRL